MNRQFSRTGQLPAGAPPASPEPSHGAGTAGFLGQAAATAAGVAGGAFLFQGLENLFGSHGGSAAGHDAQSDDDDMLSDDDNNDEDDADLI